MSISGSGAEQVEVARRQVGRVSFPLAHHVRARFADDSILPLVALVSAFMANVDSITVLTVHVGQD